MFSLIIGGRDEPISEVFATRTHAPKTHLQTPVGEQSVVSLQCVASVESRRARTFHARSCMKFMDRYTDRTNLTVILAAVP